jgi:hypothetical protein
LQHFSWSKHTKTGNLYLITANCTKLPRNIPNGRKIQFPFQGPPKYTQIGIWGMKINHLATLEPSSKHPKGFLTEPFQLRVIQFVTQVWGWVDWVEYTICDK